MVPEATYDVFLSHATPDKPAVKELARRLKRRRIKPFLDEWHLVPGEPWQEALEAALDRSQTFAVFQGPSGLGPWQNEEMRDALATRVQDKSRRVIPVLLPGASKPEQKALPQFLRRLTWVDFRGGLADAEAFHRLVSGIKGVPPVVERKRSGLPHAWPRLLGVPDRNPAFTGRRKLLSRLHQQLQTSEISALAQAAIYGLGGVGKTQIAIEYAHRFGRDYRFVLWVVPETEAALQSGYLSIARALGLVGAEVDPEVAVLALKSWLAQERDWLLVLDNAVDASLVRAYLPSKRKGGRVLLTSRAQAFADVGISKPLPVGTMNSTDAAAFLLKRTNRNEAGPAAELSKELGYLPLALEQAAAYIKTVDVSLRAYLASFKRRGLQLLEKGKAGAEYTASVATTWKISINKVQETSPASAELLTAAAFLLSDSVPMEIFTLGGSALGDLLGQELVGAKEDHLVFWELLEPLVRYSLVERLPNDAFRVHRLTQEVVKHNLGGEGRKTWAERVVRAFAAAHPGSHFKDWPLCSRLQPLARSIVKLICDYELDFKEARNVLLHVVTFTKDRGDYFEAKFLCELSLELFEKSSNSDDLFIGVIKITLKEIFVAMGLPARAEEIDASLNESKFRDLEHIAYVNSLPPVERSQYREDQYRYIAEQGSEYRSWAWIKIAEVRLERGDLDGARQLYQQALEVQERELGTEHPTTLKSKHDLAMVLFSIGDFGGARSLLEQTLEMRERVLGNEHPDTTLTTWCILLSIEKLNALDNVDAATVLLGKLRWLLDRDEDLIPSTVQRQVRQHLLNLINPS